MKKILSIFLMFMLMFNLIGCSMGDESLSDAQDTDNQSKDETDSDVTEQGNKEIITLNPENEYMKVHSIDTSSCEYEDGYFSGEISFISDTTEKYVEEYDEYYYREIYFGFYNINGELVGEEVAQNNYIYSREYTTENTTNVLVSSKHEISDVKVLKIVCEKVNDN